jgi:hypothetical protein
LPKAILVGESAETLGCLASQSSVEFIDENGGGAGVRMKRRGKRSGTRASAARNIKIWAGAFSEETQGLILTLTGTMKRFYFDLVGDLPARDILGHECSSRKEARRHACFIAHRVGTERPNFAKQGNGISVRDENGNEFFVAPIKSTVREGRLHPERHGSADRV